MFELQILITFAGTFLLVVFSSLIVNKGSAGVPDAKMKLHIDCLKKGYPDCHA